MNQTFDPTAFMNATTAEVLDTKRPLIVPGEYLGQIVKLEPTSGTISKGDRTGEIWAGIKVTYELAFNEQDKINNGGRTKAVVSKMLMLDLTPEQMLDFSKGKNIDLGQHYEAAGLNVNGQPKSPNMLEGRTMWVKIGHRSDPTDATKIYENVQGVRKQ